jgi:hypothetical protein
MSIRLGGETSRPANTSLAPTMTPACGMPHALAWNIGTTGRIVSPGPNALPAAEVAASECRNVERWV